MCAVVRAGVRCDLVAGMSDADTIRRLRADLDEAHETIRQLRETMLPVDPLPSWAPSDLTRTEEALLRILLTREIVGTDAFDAAIPHGILRDGVESDQRLRVYVHRLRRKLSPIGILTAHSRGYTLDRSTLPANHHSGVQAGAAVAA